MKQLNAVRLALLCIVVAALPAAAQTPEPKPLVITAVNKTADSATAAGAGRSQNAMARPGDVLGYSLAFTNTTRGAVNNVQFVDPLPRGLVFRTGSARADKPVRIEYSIDGGKSYTARPMIVAMENGKRVEKPAPREAYTHIRWTVSGPLAPGAQVTAGFEAEVGKSASEAK
ncbi:MAG TPA: hypothetical protein VGN76_02160 [Gemmatimonadales bacterium]|jgi:uncharacterized repeat protein (TIGR01451 family)|nr:hypothetical protein [Gemmatimonadales bacterium]